MCHNRNSFADKPRSAGNMAFVLLGFFLHAVAYVLVIVGLVAINLLTWNGYFWAVWPMLGWGIGVFSHGRATFSILWRTLIAGSQHPTLRNPSRHLGPESVTVPVDQWQRITRRLENLEAIVTSVE